MVEDDVKPQLVAQTKELEFLKRLSRAACTKNDSRNITETIPWCRKCLTKLVITSLLISTMSLVFGENTGKTSKVNSNELENNK